MMTQTAEFILKPSTFYVIIIMIRNKHTNSRRSVILQLTLVLSEAHRFFKINITYSSTFIAEINLTARWSKSSGPVYSINCLQSTSDHLTSTVCIMNLRLHLKTIHPAEFEKKSPKHYIVDQRPRNFNIASQLLPWNKNN